MAIRKRGENYFVDYYVNGERKREMIGPSKRDAKDFEGKIKAEIREGKYFDVKKSTKMTFKELLKGYFENYSNNHHKLSSQGRHQTSSRNLLPFFGKHLLKDITPSLVHQYIQKRKIKGVANATINRELALMKHAFSMATQWDWTSENPLKKVELLREPKGRVRYLSLEERESLLKAIPWYIQPIVLFAMYTGMRKEEILSLKWSQVSLKDRMVYLEETKNGERRGVPINDTALAVLKDIGKIRSLHIEYVFFNPLTDNRWQDIHHSFQRACKAAGIENFRFHDLRHTAASYLVMNGVDLSVVKDILGHKTLDMTLRYTHLSPSYKIEASKKLDFAFLNEEELEKRKALGTNWAQSSTVSDQPTFSETLNGENNSESWWYKRDSNPRPSVSKTDALSS